MSDSEGRFLLAVREGRDQEALSSLESDPSLLLSSDGEGNTALHLAAVAQRESMVGVLLNVRGKKGTRAANGVLAAAVVVGGGDDDVVAVVAVVVTDAPVFVVSVALTFLIVILLLLLSCYCCRSCCC